MILCLAPLAAAAAQPPALPAALQRRGVSPVERQELRRELLGQSAFLQRQSAVLKAAARLIGPSVVHIEADVSRPVLQMGRARRTEEAGSGVIAEIRAAPYILTSRHVVSGAAPAAIRVRLADGRVLHPSRVWEDPETDVAVMAVAAEDLAPAALGDSDAIEIGDFVLAVGSPFGLSHSVTFGIISAKGRRDLELGDANLRLQDFLQTDAAINPGNSGGPLVNLRGEVIGINTAIASNSGGNEGIGFAVPINLFIRLARELIERGRVSRAFLGVTLDAGFGPAMAAEVGLPAPQGARVVKVTENSPAAAAEIREGDVILQFDGVPIENDAHLVNLVSLTEVGKPVRVTVYRDRQVLTLRASVADRARF